MKKYLFIILLSLCTTNTFAGPSGYIGTHDNRRYGSLSDPEYRGVTKLTHGKNSLCTGVFISKNLILTNTHCALVCKTGCSAEFWNGINYETSGVKTVLYSDNYEPLNGSDWALLSSDQESIFYKQISPTTTSGQVFRGGYGILRVIEDDEIPFLKKLYSQTKEEFREACSKKFKSSAEFLGCINAHLDEKLKQMGKEPLFADQNNFKVQTCKILGNYPDNNKIVVTDCDSSGGDSGAPLLRNDSVVGLNSGGKQTIFGNKQANAYGIKTENFYWPVQMYINKPLDLVSTTQNDTNKIVNSWNMEEIALDSATSTTSEYIDNETKRLLEQKLQDFDCD